VPGLRGKRKKIGNDSMSRFLKVFIGVILFGFVLAPGFAGAEEDKNELADIRAEMAKIKEAYEAEIARLEGRIAELEARQDETETSVQEARQAQYGAPSAPTGTESRASGDSNAFNPAIGVIFNGRVSAFKQDPEMYFLPGFPLGGESGPGPEGFALDETELNLSASVNDLFRASVTLAFDASSEGTEVELEEGFIETLSLPAGLRLKFGRFFASLGYLNENHSHTDNFVDRPLPYQAFLADQFNDDGVELSVVLPTTLYVKLGGALFRGGDFPGGGAPNGGVGAYNLFVRLGGDIGNETTWRLGISYLHTEAVARETGEGLEDLFPLLEFTGDTDLIVFDGKLQWSPNGNTTRRYVFLQGEFMKRFQDGTFNSIAYKGEDSGFYVEGIVKFARGWRTGYRYSQLNPEGTIPVLLLGTLVDGMGLNPKTHSFMVDWSRNEFSTLRIQFTRENSRFLTDNRFFIQYIMSIGAHGAHNF